MPRKLYAKEIIEYIILPLIALISLSFAVWFILYLNKQDRRRRAAAGNHDEEQQQESAVSAAGETAIAAGGAVEAAAVSAAAGRAGAGEEERKWKGEGKGREEGGEEREMGVLGPFRTRESEPPEPGPRPNARRLGTTTTIEAGPSVGK